MKLTKKIIPIGTIFTTAATLAPVVLTSCSSKVSDLNYIPSVTQHAIQEFDSSDQVLNEYFNCCKANPEIIIQDYLWTRAQYWNSWLAREESEISNKSVTFYASLSDVSFDIKSLESKEYYLISGSVVYNYTRKLTQKGTVESQEATFAVKETHNRKYNFKNLILYSANLYNKVWEISTSYNNNFDWSVEEVWSSNAETRVTCNNVVKTYYNKSQGESLCNMYSTYYFGDFLDVNSYYLKNVTLG